MSKYEVISENLKTRMEQEGKNRTFTDFSFDESKVLLRKT